MRFEGACAAAESAIYSTRPSPGSAGKASFVTAPCHFPRSRSRALLILIPHLHLRLHGHCLFPLFSARGLYSRAHFMPLLIRFDPTPAFWCLTSHGHQLNPTCDLRVAAAPPQTCLLDTFPPFAPTACSPSSRLSPGCASKSHSARQGRITAQRFRGLVEHECHREHERASTYSRTLSSQDLWVASAHQRWPR